MRQFGVRIASMCLNNVSEWSLEEVRFDWQSQRDVEAYEAQHKAQLKSIYEGYEKAHKRFSVHNDSDSDGGDTVAAQDDGNDSDKVTENATDDDHSLTAISGSQSGDVAARCDRRWYIRGVISLCQIRVSHCPVKHAEVQVSCAVGLRDAVEAYIGPPE